MAVLSKFPGLKVSVRVQGVPVEEYDNDEEGSKPGSLSKYIESKSEEEFDVKFKIPKRIDTPADLRFRLFLDGKLVDRKIIRGSKWQRQSYSFKVSGTKSKVNGEWEIRNFMFSPLSIGDTEDRETVNLPELGLIVADVSSTRIIGDSKPTTAKPLPELSSLATIAEKQLKGNALSHQSILKPPKPCGPRNYVKTEECREPFARFEFKYRSKDALKALCILPRSPSPVSLEDKPEDELTREELLELLRRQREKSSANVKKEIKREHGHVFVPDDEVTMVSHKRRRMEQATINEEGIEVIDLT